MTGWKIYVTMNTPILGGVYFTYYVVALVLCVAVAALMLAGVVSMEMLTGILDSVNPGASA